MRWPLRLALLLSAALVASPAAGQLSQPSTATAVPIDTSNLATQQQLQDALAAAAQAKAAADAATAAAAAAQTNASTAATTASQAKTAADTASSSLAAVQSKADAAATAAAASVKTVNGSTPTNGNVALAIPTPSVTTPPGVADSGNLGTMTTMYALANHTHASKARKIIADTTADGLLTWTFTTPFATGTIPVCVAIAQVASGVTDVINVQTITAPSATSATFLVNRANRSVANLLGLTVLSIPSSPGVTRVHAVCLEP